METEETGPEPDSVELQLGYTVAANLLGAELQTQWNRFNVMLVANSIVLGALGLLLVLD